MGSALSGGGRPTPYAELADLVDSLPLLLREARRARRLSQRAVAREIGISAATISRIESGEDYVASHVATFLRWLDRAPAGTDG